MSKKIFIASDHAGLDYKNKVKEYLINNNFEVVDFGNSLYNDLDDYPDFLHEAGRALSLNNEDSLSIVFGGSGVGESVLMNRYKKVISLKNIPQLRVRRCSRRDARARFSIRSLSQSSFLTSDSLIAIHSN